MPTYKIEFSPYAERDFARLPKDLQRRIFSKLIFFEKQENSFLFSNKLQETDNRYRFRIGDYRVIFTPINQKVMVILLILKIRHRREVYE